MTEERKFRGFTTRMSHGKPDIGGNLPMSKRNFRWRSRSSNPVRHEPIAERTDGRLLMDLAPYRCDIRRPMIDWAYESDLKSTNGWTLTERNSAGADSRAMMSQLMEIMRISTLAELASGIAHELNQPLGAIATYAQAGERMLNRSQPLISETSEVLRQINHQALGAGEGIRRIRRLFEQDETVRVSCRIPDLIEEMQPLLEMLTRRIHGQLRIEAADDLPPVNVERLKVQHVLFALVENACDASAEVSGEPRIDVTVTSSRYEVQTRISDCGSGVPPTMREQLFRPFYTTKPRGTGLGLASSRAIIEAHEGTIGFENIASGGSRFWFRLPVAGQ